MSSIESYRSIFGLEARTAIVTGGSRGIGKALCEELAAHGADVAIVVRSSVDRAELVAKGIRAAGRDAMVIKADISNEVDVQSMTDEVMRRWGRIDILVNNAGIILPTATENCSIDDWRRTMAVNLDGVYMWAKGAVQNRIGSVEELVGATVYLASDAASFTTGEIITIDGGLTLR